MNRKVIPFIIAFILSCLVMVVSGVFAFSGIVTAQKFGSKTAWSQPYSTAESMKVIDLTGDGQNELFIQNINNVSAFDGGGNILWSHNYNQLKTTLGDFNGDGTEDVIVFHSGGVDVIINGQIRTLATGLPIGTPSRVALIRFASGPQIVLGDTGSYLLSLDLNGQTLWSANIGSDEIRGMDDARINGQVHLAVASYNGGVYVIDSNGQTVWNNENSQIRRMRAFDLNADGNSEVITGSEYGDFYIYSAKDGSVIFNKSLGQAVSEVREVELDGDPSSR
ncbi:MAG: hypothetical protein ACK40V_04375, partial [Anaerolineales bacterium]